ncbi:hypothetical protein HHK36_017297 [Tetracentron sinense]|uniref:NAC domain-containing protein n=1 Tax=Tetracentron sinense TaxID=13715 RepID=A0A834Z2Y5_TETSI|nr:hypothetical protein HHK36_017297 [Tetracentron sinense]
MTSQNPNKEDQEVGQQQQNGDGSTNGNIFEAYPPGYRFCPYDEELINYYLKKKVLKQRLPINNINELKQCLHQLPDNDKMSTHSVFPKRLWVRFTRMYKLYREKEWYFFSPRDRKYPNGTRPNRAAGAGYWKATGTDMKISSNGQLVGYKNTLVYYKGKPPKGEKTTWIMYEYKVADELNPQTIRTADKMRLDDWVLCRLKKQKEKKKKQDDESMPTGDSIVVFDEPSAPVNEPDPSAVMNYDIGIRVDGNLFVSSPPLGNGKMCDSVGLINKYNDSAFDQVLQHNISGFPLESNHMTNMGFETENQAIRDAVSSASGLGEISYHGHHEFELENDGMSECHDLRNVSGEEGGGGN